MNSFKSYLRRSAFEYILTTIVSVALVYVCLNGFYIKPSWQSSVVPAIASIVCMALLFLCASSRKRALPLGIAYGALCLVVLIVAAVKMGNAFAVDVEGNYLIFALACIAVPTLVFALSRNRVLAAILLLVAVFACSWIQFFYSTDEVVWSVIVLLGALALVVYKNFQTSALKATTVKKLSFGKGFALAVGTSLAAVLIGVLAWALVIGPLDPGVFSIKLMTETRALETVEVHGTSSEYLTPNLDLTSKKTNDLSRTTDDLQEGEDGIDTPARAKKNSTSEEQSSGSFMGIDTNSLKQAFDFKSNPAKAVISWSLLFLIPLLIIIYFLWRRIWRNIRLKRIREKDPSEQVEIIYLFLMKRFARLGYKPSNGYTPLEYASNLDATLQGFVDESGVGFTQLASAYCAVEFGKTQATQEQADDCARFYRVFWKAARKQLGNVRYFFKSFRL